MRTIAAILSLAILFLAGCAAPQPAAATPPAENSPVGTDQEIDIVLRKTGGFAGVDESWQIAADGHITTSDGDTGQVSISDLNAAVEQLEAAGFFELQEFLRAAGYLLRPLHLPAHGNCGWQAPLGRYSRSRARNPRPVLESAGGREFIAGERQVAMLLPGPGSSEPGMLACHGN